METTAAAGLHFFLYILLFSFLHECAHAFVMRQLGGSGRMGNRAVFGNVLYLNRGLRRRHRLMVYAAGPLLNVTVAAAVYGSMRFFHFYNRDAAYLFYANVMLSAFNLLPFFPLDGGRIAVLLLSTFLSEQRVIKIALVFSYLFAVSVFLLGVYLVKYNIMNVILIFDALYFAAIVERERKNEIFGSKRLYEFK